VGIEVLSLDLEAEGQEAEGQEAELGLDLNIHGLNFGSTERTGTRGLLSHEFLLLLFANVHKPQKGQTFLVVVVVAAEMVKPRGMAKWPKQDHEEE